MLSTRLPACSCRDRVTEPLGSQLSPQGLGPPWKPPALQTEQKLQGQPDQARGSQPCQSGMSLLFPLYK